MDAVCAPKTANGDGAPALRKQEPAAAALAMAFDKEMAQMFNRWIDLSDGTKYSGHSFLSSLPPAVFRRVPHQGLLWGTVIFSSRQPDSARVSVAKIIREMVADLADRREDPALAKQILGRINADLTALCDLPAAKG